MLTGGLEANTALSQPGRGALRTPASERPSDLARVRRHGLLAEVRLAMRFTVFQIERLGLAVLVARSRNVEVRAAKRAQDEVEDGVDGQNEVVDVPVEGEKRVHGEGHARSCDRTRGATFR